MLRVVPQKAARDYNYKLWTFVELFVAYLMTSRELRRRSGCQATHWIAGLIHMDQ